MKRRVTGEPANRRKDSYQLGVLEAAFGEQPYPDMQAKRRLAHQTGLSPQQVESWFGRQRQERGIAATSNAEYICQPPTWVAAQRRRDAEAAAAAQEAAAAAEEAAMAAATERARRRQAERDRREAEQELRAHRRRELLVEGEVVELNPDPDDGAVWCAVRPRVGRPGEPFPPLGPQQLVLPGHGLLDSGNAAVTMINRQTAVAAGLAADPTLSPMQIRGVNGVEAYPLARVSIRIRGVGLRIIAALGGSQGVLVGEDVLGPMFEAGYTIAGFYGRRTAAGRVQWVREGFVN